MTKVRFDKGIEANLPTPGMAEDGHLYLSSDNGNMYLGMPNGSLLPLNRSPYYGTCSTASETNSKVVTLDTEVFSLYGGVMITVRFENANTASSPTINVNSTGAIAVKLYGTTAADNTPAKSWNAGEAVTFVYDGSYWLLVGGGVPPEMSEMSYGHSTWNDFITAYKTHSVVYCKASSNSNPASGSQTRKAFLAYVNNDTNPTEVEFQYYRSIQTHTDSQQGDQVFVYKLTPAKGGTWTVTVRNAFTKVVAGTNMSSSYSNGTITLNSTPTDISGKADKVQNATAGNFAGLDSTGNLTDSGYKPSDFLTQHQNLPEYTIEKLAQAETSYSASYVLKKDGTQVGATINIPKDMVVSSGEVKTVTTANVPYQGAVVGDKYIDLTIANTSQNHIYIPVKDLVDVYVAGNGIQISNNNYISVKVNQNQSNGLGVGYDGISMYVVTPSINGVGGTNGSMLATDKEKLDGIEAGAEENVIETVKVSGTALQVTDKAVNIETETAYNPTTNKIATMSDVESATPNVGHLKTDNTTSQTPSASESFTSDISLHKVSKTGSYNDLNDTPVYALGESVGGPAKKAISIPFGQVDSTSTSTSFTATIDGITELRDGVCCYLKNGVITSASGFTININGLGAKPVYNTMASTTAFTTQFNVNYTMLFIYNSTRVSGGCWDMYVGYDTNTTYNLNTNYTTIGHINAGAYPLQYNSLCAFDINDKLTPFVTTATTSTGKTLVPSVFPIGAKIYASNYNVSANESLNDANYLLTTAANQDLRYSSVNHNLAIFPNNTFNRVFMPVIVDVANNTFTLTTQTTNGYTNNFTNERSLKADNFYIEIGFNGKYDYSFYCTLIQNNPLYYYDGTRLIEYSIFKSSIIDVPEYTIEKLASAETGYSSSYVLKKDNVQVGATINIPKDMVVSNGEVKTVTTANVPYQGAQVGDKYIDLTIANATTDHLYIPVKDLVDVYTEGNGIDVSSGNVISVVVDPNNANGLSVGASGVALATATTSSAGAMSAADKTKLEGIASGAEVNVQSDWNQTDNTSDDFIKNKPSIPTATSDLTNDSGFITSADIADKADKVSNATNGNFAGLDASGNLTDSGSKASDFATSTHVHGNITNAGALQTNDITIASGDKLVVTDTSDSGKIARTSIAFDGTTTNTALTPKGTFERFLQSSDLNTYWANQQLTSEAVYNTEPEFKTVTINGSTNSSIASTENGVLLYDTEEKCIKFMFN